MHTIESDIASWCCLLRKVTVFHLEGNCAHYTKMLPFSLYVTFPGVLIGIVRSHKNEYT